MSDRESGPPGGSDSSRTVGDIAWVIFFRLDDKEEDICRSMRDARLDFFSFSSLVEEPDPAVGGGEKAWSRLDVERRLLIDIGR
jgi:hypothetical protein